MAAFFSTKLIISASILLRKSFLGSKLEDMLRSAYEMPKVWSQIGISNVRKRPEITCEHYLFLMNFKGPKDNRL